MNAIPPNILFSTSPDFPRGRSAPAPPRLRHRPFFPSLSRESNFRPRARIAASPFGKRIRQRPSRGRNRGVPDDNSTIACNAPNLHDGRALPGSFGEGKNTTDLPPVSGRRGIICARCQRTSCWPLLAAAQKGSLKCSIVGGLRRSASRGVGGATPNEDLRSPRQRTHFVHPFRCPLTSGELRTARSERMSPRPAWPETADGGRAASLPRKGAILPSPAPVFGRRASWSVRDPFLRRGRRRVRHGSALHVPLGNSIPPPPIPSSGSAPASPAG